MLLSSGSLSWFLLLRSRVCRISLIFSLCCISGRLLLSFLLSTSAFTLLTTLLSLEGERIVVLLEVSRALDNNLETWLRSGLDLGHMNVAPSREDVDHLSQPGHASLIIAVKLELIMLVQVEHVLDNADILDYVKPSADRQDIAQVLLGSLTSVVGATLTAPLLTRSSTTVAARRRLVARVVLPCTSLLGSVVLLGIAILASTGLASGAAVLARATISSAGGLLLLRGVDGRVSSLVS